MNLPSRNAVIVETDISLTLDVDAIDWDNGEILNLPEGVKVKIVNEDTEISRRDMFVKFPSGYIEPEHTHSAGHAVIILDGKMLVHGHELTPGDYIYGQQAPHGPMEYPEGCIVFASFIGGSVSHNWTNDQTG